MKIHKIFFGWWIVGSLTLIAALVAGTTGRSFTAIFEPMASEFGWNYAQVSIAASIRGLEGPLLSPIVGFVFDRWGPRRWIFAGVFISGISILLFSRITSLAGLYGVSFLMAIGMSTCTGMLPTVVLGNWFHKKAGLAMSIVLCGGLLAGIMVPVVTHLIDTSGWRNAMVIVGIGIMVICLPLSLLIRHKPEQYGCFPDGDSQAGLVHEQKSSSTPGEADFGVKQALRSRGFWHIAVVMMCSMVVSNSVIVHVMPYLSSVGLSRSVASYVAMAIPLVCIIPRLGFGWFVDKFDKRLMGTIACVFCSVSMLFFVYIGVSGEWMTILFLIFYGIGLGGLVPVLLALQRYYFGTARLGSIMGLIGGLAVFGGMVGPPLIGWLFDRYGSYNYSWFAAFGVMLIGTIIMAAAPKTNRSISTTSKI